MSVTCSDPRAQALEKALGVIGSKWTLLILYNLCFSTKGFNELLRSMQGVSPRILSIRLKELVEQGLVSKTVKPTTPPQVEYAITKQGESLRTILDQLAKWSEAKAA